MIRKDLHFDLPPDFNKQGFFDNLGKEFATRKVADVAGRRVYLDTFDWRLYRESLKLYSTGDRLVLAALDGDLPVKSIDTPTIPVFAGDIPGSGLRDRLSEIIDVRALLPLAEALTAATSVRILNNDEKTIARVELEDIKFVEGRRITPVSLNVRLKPVRGYERQARNIGVWLRRNGFVPVSPASADSYSSLLAASGKRPGDYSAKLDFELDPGMSSYEALLRIFRFLCGVMQRNIEGIKRDVDTEFLHDFRVASRRTRAGLVQLRKVLPKGVAGSFRRRFAVFGEATNRLRDLDVYLLNAKSYRELVPGDIREHIEPLFEHLRIQRAAELERVRTWLESDECRGTLDAWERILAMPLPEGKGNRKSALPVIDLANSSIRSRHKIVVEAGADAVAAPRDEALHALRIECKKLRYLLEFFSSLYDKTKITLLVSQLKKLQDNLGRHQDICFQQEGLRKFAGEMTEKGGSTGLPHVAVGSLIGSLETDKHDTRDAFAKVFGNFTSAENTRLFQELFGANR